MPTPDRSAGGAPGDWGNDGKIGCPLLVILVGLTVGAVGAGLMLLTAVIT